MMKGIRESGIFGSKTWPSIEAKQK